MSATTYTEINENRTRDWGILFLLIVGVAALSVFFFSQQSLRLDEAQSLWQTSRSPAAILTTIAKDVHVPFYHMTLHFWRVFFGDGVGAARVLSLIFYCASIPALYALGKLAYSRNVGLFAALLLAISPFMNWYGSEIRMYTLFTFLAIVNQYFFLRIHKLKDGGAWLGYAGTALLGVFTHYFFLLNLGAQALFYLLHRRQFPTGAFLRFTGIAVLLLLALAPWAAYIVILGEAGNAGPALSVPTTVNLFNALAQFLFGFQDDHLNTILVSLWPVALILAFLAMRKNARFTSESSYFALTILFSIGVAFLISVFVRPVFVSRYLIFVIPALYLLLASILEIYPRAVSRLLKVTLVVVMLATLAVEIVSAATPVKEDYRAVAEYLEANAKPHDIILLSAPFTIYPVEYYYKGSSPILTIPYWDRYALGPIPTFSATDLPQQVSELTDGYERMWIVLSYDQGYEESVRAYFEGNFERLEMKEFSPGLTMYLYRIRYDTQNAP